MTQWLDVQDDAREQVRGISKLLFGNRLRMEVAAAIATEPSAVVFARALAQRLRINDNQAASELKNLERAGLLEPADSKVGVSYRRLPSEYWKLASRIFEESWRRAVEHPALDAKQLAGIGSHRDSATSKATPSSPSSPLLRLQSDERLLELAKSGNDDALDAIFARYGPRLRAYSRHLVGSVETAEKVLTETYSAARRELQQQPASQSVRPWLYRLTHACALRHIDSPHAEFETTARGRRARHNQAPSGDAETERTVIKPLPANQRAALMMRELEGMSYEQIADAMAIPVDDVMVLLVHERAAGPRLRGKRCLLRRAQRDPTAFAEFYDAYVHQVLRYFVRRVADAEIALDLTSETFAAALEQRDRFRGKTAQDEQGWLFAIARGILSQYWRRGAVERRSMSRLGVAVPELSETDLDRVEELADVSDLRASLEHALNDLPENQREAVRLRIIDEMTYEEIALQLGLSEDVVRARVSRGLRALRRALDEASAERVP